MISSYLAKHDDNLFIVAEYWRQTAAFQATRSDSKYARAFFLVFILCAYMALLASLFGCWTGYQYCSSMMMEGWTYLVKSGHPSYVVVSVIGVSELK